MTSLQDQENAPDVITGMLKVVSIDVYALLDLGASFSFVTPYVAMRFDIPLNNFLSLSVFSHLLVSLF